MSASEIPNSGTASPQTVTGVPSTPAEGPGHTTFEILLKENNAILQAIAETLVGVREELELVRSALYLPNDEGEDPDPIAVILDVIHAEGEKAANAALFVAKANHLNVALLKMSAPEQYQALIESMGSNGTDKEAEGEPEDEGGLRIEESETPEPEGESDAHPDA